MYKMDSFALFTANAWRKNGFEVIGYGGKIWINQGHLQEKLGIAKFQTKFSIILTNLKKWDAKYKSKVNINLVECLLKIL